MVAQAKGSFVPTTYVFDVAQFYDVDVNTPEFRELLVRLGLYVNSMNEVLNTKETGLYYPNQPLITSTQYFPLPGLTANTPRQAALRAELATFIAYFNPLPVAGTVMIPHNIAVNDSFTFTHIEATATDPVGHNYIPIPYASPVLAENIAISVDGTNVTITTGNDRSNFIVTYILLKYLTT